MSRVRTVLAVERHSGWFRVELWSTSSGRLIERRRYAELDRALGYLASLRLLLS